MQCILERKRVSNGIAGIILSCLAVPAAFGTPISYVFSGLATGSLGATTFTNAQVSVIATADTLNLTTSIGGVPCIYLASVTINIEDLGYVTTTGQNVMFDDPAANALGLANGTCSAPGADWLAQDNPSAAAYGLITTIGPTTATFAGGGNVVPTTGGALSFNAAPAIFQAALQTADQSDLWYIPAESGWGMQLVQRGTVIFATLFVYGISGEPFWYVATLDYMPSLTWTGTLYGTTGTFFADPWNPALFTGIPIGSMTWVPQTADTGMLIYYVLGHPAVVKNVVRQTLVLENYGGHYAGGLHDIITGCANPAANGTFDLGSVLDVTQNGAAVTIKSDGANGVTCTYTGTLTQSGQMGTMPGASFACTDGSSGQTSVDQLQVNSSGITGTFTANYSVPPGCQSSGWFGGFRGTTF